uniref:Uncharacterized protein n=1 Tax=Salix viminalis TaxID=40686 RepID=A0A6N2MUB4_SALVM
MLMGVCCQKANQPPLQLLMEDDVSNPFRRMSMRTRKIAPRMAAALASNDNRTQPAIARIEALENDYPLILLNDFVGERLANKRNCSIAQPTPQPYCKYSLITIAVYIQKKQKGTKRKTRQTKALENARKAPINFLELLHEANLEALPLHVPSYMRASMGPPSSTWHFYTVCGFTSNYTYAKCGMPLFNPMPENT